MYWISPGTKTPYKTPGKKQPLWEQGHIRDKATNFKKPASTGFLQTQKALEFPAGNP
ncbi:hypothetical protein GCM10008938_04110 [Deinococcus roseus]|uniref:Uncharacterized protein n=1 Tax=Deinococcus roseus TaxID=392414 RepID=A0ABQ2CY36_9DEIO|nr:hypothetical protein GCM10008938_04110 [Deinococcus roseus]